jgi:hypothetical protein
MRNGDPGFADNNKKAPGRMAPELFVVAKKRGGGARAVPAKVRGCLASGTASINELAQFCVSKKY